MRDDRIRVALFQVGDDMYPREYLERDMKEVRALVEEMDLELAAVAQILNEADGLRAEQALRGQAFDAIIVNFVSWHITPYLMRALRHFRGTPVVVWGVGGRTDATGKIHSPAAPAGVTALVPLLREMGFPFWIECERPDEPHRAAQVWEHLRLIQVARRIQSARVGLVGYADMGLYSCSYDRSAVLQELGIDVENYFSTEITQRMDACPAPEAARLRAEVRAGMRQENDIPEETLDRVVRLYWAMKGQADERALDAISIKCVHGVTKFLGFSPCLAQTLLAGTGLSVICECDAYGLITQVILSRLTGQTAAFMENYEVFDDAVLVGACGFMPPAFVEGPLKIRATDLGETIRGVSNVSAVRTGQVTFARLYRENNRFKMFFSRGEALPNPRWTEIGWSEPTPAFPSVRLQLEIPVSRYLENVPGQHIVLAYGDWTDALERLCGLLGVEPVRG